MTLMWLLMILSGHHTQKCFFATVLQHDIQKIAIKSVWNSFFESIEHLPESKMKITFLMLQLKVNVYFFFLICYIFIRNLAIVVFHRRWCIVWGMCQAHNFECMSFILKCWWLFLHYHMCVHVKNTIFLNDDLNKITLNIHYVLKWSPGLLQWHKPTPP